MSLDRLVLTGEIFVVCFEFALTVEGEFTVELTVEEEYAGVEAAAKAA